MHPLEEKKKKYSSHYIDGYCTTKAMGRLEHGGLGGRWERENGGERGEKKW